MLALPVLPSRQGAKVLCNSYSMIPQEVNFAQESKGLLLKLQAPCGVSLATWHLQFTVSTFSYESRTGQKILQLPSAVALALPYFEGPL